jgi:hypothetical protein
MLNAAQAGENYGNGCMENATCRKPQVDEHSNLPFLVNRFTTPKNRANSITFGVR